MVIVTPFVGVWIETMLNARSNDFGTVTPFVGVWIETWRLRTPSTSNRSHTLRGCVD